MTAPRQITIRIGTLRVDGLSEAEIPRVRAALAQALARAAPALAGRRAPDPPAATQAEAVAASVLAAVRRRLAP